MSPNEIRRLIDASARATESVRYFADLLQAQAEELKLVGEQNWQEVALQLVTRYIWNTDKWTSDRFGRRDYQRAIGDDRYPPSQVLLPIIKELEGLPALLVAQRLRGRKTISTGAFRALLQIQPLGPELIHSLQKEGSRVRPHIIYKAFGLGGVIRGKNESDRVYGFDNPAPLTESYSSNLRLMKRSLAQAYHSEKAKSGRKRKSGRNGLLGVQFVDWHLNQNVATAFMAARRIGSGRHFSLEDVRANINVTDRNNLAECARQAARLLEITLHLTDRTKEGPLGETVETWLHPAPLLRFVVSIFEEMSPSREQALVDIKRSMNKEDDLTKSAIAAAEEGIDCARKIVTLIPQFENIDLDTGVALLAISEEFHRSERMLARNGVLDRGHKGAMRTEGRTIVVKQLWQDRQNIVTLKGYAVFMNWYMEHAKQIISKDLIPTWKLVNRDIFYALQDWSRELQARYDEGVLFKRDIKRRAGGLPLTIPSTPGIVESHFIKLTNYPMNLAFDYELRQGAVVNPKVLNAIVQSLCEERPKIYEAWHKLTSAVPVIMSAKNIA
jgi:hypothetical protein